MDIKPKTGPTPTTHATPSKTERTIKAPPAKPSTPRARASLTMQAHAVTARDKIANAINEHELALAHVTALGFDNPILGELRDAIKTGRVMLARANELIKRIPAPVAPPTVKK